MKNKPAYAIESVDHALHLVQVLQQGETLRVTDAAELLGVSVSTAHRLLAMLVYRGFAEQDVNRRYFASDVLHPTDPSVVPVALLRRVSLPHLRRLVDDVGESANLVVLVGRSVRFVASVECTQILRVGDRAGRLLPAQSTSGGKAILASRSADELARLLASEDIDLAKLSRELSLVHRRGFAINNQQTEAGVTALGVAVRDISGRAGAAVSLALPTARYDRSTVPRWVAALERTAVVIGAELAGNEA